MPDGGLEWSARTGDGAVWSLVFTPDGRQLLSASDIRLRIWDVETGMSNPALSPQGGRITRAALSPAGVLVAVATTAGEVALWDLKQAVVANEIVADDNALWSVAFSPDGEQIATASSDEVVALWDLRTGTRRASFSGFRGGATDVAYLADGVTLVAIDRGGKLHWWDTQTGRRLTDAWQAHEGPSWRIAVHPDGLRFVTAGDDGHVKVWDELSVAEACRISAVALDGVRREQYLGEDGRSVACDQEL
jgi:WD40 repeat protein